MRPITADLLSGEALHREVVLDKLLHARESVWIATANVKEMRIETTPGAKYRSIVEAFAGLARRGVALRLLHAELPSRPFRAAFDRQARLVAGGLELRICPRPHVKAVIVDGAWVYLGSANLTGAGLGAKGPDRRNFELGFVTEDFDVLDRVQALFESIWSGAECTTCRVRDTCPDPRAPEAPRTRRAGVRSTDRLGRARRLPVLPPTR